MNMLSPIGQPQDEEFDEGRLEQQLPVLEAELWETRDVLSPNPHHLRAGSEQIVELLHVRGVHLLGRTHRRLLVLKQEGSREIKDII